MDTTKEGIDNMVKHVYEKDGVFYLVVKGTDAKTRGYILTYKEQGNEIIKFYAYKRLKDDYGSDIAELVELLVIDPNKYTDKYNDMGWEQFDQMLQKHMADSRRQEEWEEMEHGPHDESTRDDQRTFIKEIETTPNINRIFNDSSTQTPKQVIDKLLDVPEEELKASGFTDH